MYNKTNYQSVRQQHVPWSRFDSYLQLFNMQPCTNISSLTPPNIMIIAYPRQYFSKKILLHQNVYNHQSLRNICSAIPFMSCCITPSGLPTQRQSSHNFKNILKTTIFTVRI